MSNDDFGRIVDEGAALMKEFKASVKSMRYDPNVAEIKVMKGDKKIENLASAHQLVLVEIEKMKEEIDNLRYELDAIKRQLRGESDF